MILEATLTAAEVRDAIEQYVATQHPGIQVTQIQFQSDQGVQAGAKLTLMKIVVPSPKVLYRSNLDDK